MLIIIKYNREDLDVQEIKQVSEILKTKHPTHEFLLMPKDWEYEVIKNECYEQSIRALSGCSEEISGKPDRGVLSPREPELWTGDTKF